MMRILTLLLIIMLSFSVLGEIVTSEEFLVDEKKEYKWLLKRGDLTFWLKGSDLMFKIDPKGEKSCFLTIQDALDVYSILRQFGQKIFDISDSSVKYDKKVMQESDNSFYWNIDNDQLRIYLNKESEFLQISHSGESPIPLDIGLISEIAQVIGIIINNAANEKS